jgi:hypothetical protein
MRKSRIVSRVPLGDNREVRVTRIPLGVHEDLIRVGTYVLPSGDTMSGVVFPESALPEVIDALQKVD